LSLDERAFFFDRCDKSDAGARFFFPAAGATDREAVVGAVPGFFFPAADATDREAVFGAVPGFFFPAIDATDRQAFVDAGFFFFDFPVYFFVHAAQWFLIKRRHSSL